MIFPVFREFRSVLKEASAKEIVGYLTVELGRFLRELMNGLTRLSFDDNFDCFTTTVTIQNGAELGIRNQLKNGIPSKRILVRGADNSHLIVDGPTTWTKDFVYLKNNHGSPLTITVVFFK
jgi:hypothetical protein